MHYVLQSAARQKNVSLPPQRKNLYFLALNQDIYYIKRDELFGSQKHCFVGLFAIR